jgi:tetratricopeptide (TPR) repeat protein
MSKDMKRLGMMAAVVCLAGLSISDARVGARSGSVEDTFFKRVVMAADEGRILEAKDDVRRVLKLNPRHVGAIFYGAQIWYEMGETAKAKAMFERIKNDKEYGARASSIIADMQVREREVRDADSINVLLTGGAYDAALRLSEDYLRDMPGNFEVMYKAALLACVLNNRDKAESYAVRFRQLQPKDLRGIDLNNLLEGWFVDEFAQEGAASAGVDYLMAIEDRALLINPVKTRIRELLAFIKDVSRFERFIAREVEAPGADTGALEKELIGFFIANEKYTKALEALERRPVDSLDDNLLYVEILVKTGKEEKAMENAGYLINANPEELRCYKAWINAWVSYVDRKQSKPTGANAKLFNDRAESILKTLKPENFITSDPVLLINMFRMSVLTENILYANEVKTLILKITFTDKLADMLLHCTDELVAFYRRDMAMELLQGAWNQLPKNNLIPMKMAEITMDTEPEASIKITEIILEENPEHTSALLIWSESMSRVGKAQEAADRLSVRLEDPDLDPMIARQLQAKVDMFAYQGAQKRGGEESDDDDEVDYGQDDYWRSFSAGASQSIDDPDGTPDGEPPPPRKDRLPKPRREFLSPIEK